ncbi:MAG: S1C family serine protease [Planctomycetota bacterium]
MSCTKSVTTAFMLAVAFVAPAFGQGRPRPGAERHEDIKHWLERVGGVRSVSPWQRDHASVRAAFEEVVAEPRKATVRILANDVQVALGVIVAADGLILTKASELNGDLTCSLSDGRQLSAEIIGVNEEHDVALLKVVAQELPVVRWAADPIPVVGSWLATPSPDPLPAAIGIVSVEPRAVSAPSGFLGVSLDNNLPRILAMTAGGGAEKAGLQINDLILKVNGQEVANRESLQRLIRRYQPGQKLVLSVQRANGINTITAVLGDGPNAASNERSEMQNRLGTQVSQRRGGFPQALQHDSVLRPNECGGPLVDLDGRTVAVNIARAGRVACYAIPASVVVGLIEELKTGKHLPEHLAKAATNTVESINAADTNVSRP